MSFAAKYPGRCASDACDYGDGRIDIGDEIEYFGDELMHTSCVAQARRVEPPLCISCFQYHRGECL